MVDCVRITPIMILNMSVLASDINFSPDTQTPNTSPPHYQYLHIIYLYVFVFV